ncbi:hypothetical protein PYW08_008489 [Mythimna loreyi]|uniref:Uncharacterized protein n=2 Tax=Mythimna loreyi TaxID=667449 RepID=A0ACC2QDG0_9NEOP|nr:hypothetical protein PYW08_010311 [Mythimna loreyi]KAJ8713185.1 hypothetical protein PYW08_008489 [Mythimna loreyi]
MPGIKCGGCGRFTSTQDGVKCGKCLAHYHRACVGVPIKAALSAGWRCPECTKGVVRDNRADTPVRGTSECTIKKSAEQVPFTTAVGSKPVSPVAYDSAPRAMSYTDNDCIKIPPVSATDASAIMEELRAMRAEIQSFRKEMELEMAGLKVAMGSCNDRIDRLEARLDALEQRASDPPKPGAAEELIEDLMRELNDRDQALLVNDIEITNIPEASADNPAHVIQVIGLKLGVSLDERDIVSAERVGGRQLNATGSGGAQEARPRAIVVRLARREVRDRLLASARVRRGATTADLDMPGPARRFFLNERLTRTNRQLFRKARDAASLTDWKYVWTKRGRILARRKAGDATHWIRSEADISRVFGPVDTV